MVFCVTTSNQDVLRAVFWSAVIGLIENPALISSNVSLAEVLNTVQQVFRYGILKRPERQTSASHKVRRKKHGKDQTQERPRRHS